MWITFRLQQFRLMKWIFQYVIESNHKINLQWKNERLKMQCKFIIFLSGINGNWIKMDMKKFDVSALLFILFFFLFQNKIPRIWSKESCIVIGDVEKNVYYCCWKEMHGKRKGSKNHRQFDSIQCNTIGIGKVKQNKRNRMVLDKLHKSMKRKWQTEYIAHTQIHIDIYYRTYNYGAFDMENFSTKL